MSKDRLINIGAPPVGCYPIKAWERWPDGVRCNDVWKLCGPTVENHIHRLPLWQVFCAVYFEGLAHGAGVAKESK